jgi:hypothetical protein
MSEYKHVHTGACDCGAVKFEYHCDQDLTEHTARACQCEFCKPRQASYLSLVASELRVHLKDRRYLYAYRFGTNTADFMHCAVCNSQVFVKTRVDDQDYALVYAPALARFSELTDFSPVNYDEEVLSDRLQRRAQNWIAKLDVISERET